MLVRSFQYVQYECWVVCVCGGGGEGYLLQQIAVNLRPGSFCLCVCRKGRHTHRRWLSDWLSFRQNKLLKANFIHTVFRRGCKQTRVKLDANIWRNFTLSSLPSPISPSLPSPFLLSLSRAGIFKQSMRARNRVGRGLSFRPARLRRLAELNPWNLFLELLKSLKIRALLSPPHSPLSPPSPFFIPPSPGLSPPLDTRRRSKEWNPALKSPCSSWHSMTW